MFYSINKEDVYIFGVVKGVDQKNANCTEEEYEYVRACLGSMPTAPKGYCYRLNENLEWVLCKIPDVEINTNEDATEFDYQDALESLGADFNA